MTKKDKLRKLLEDTFGDEPDAFSTVHKSIFKEYEKKLGKLEKAHDDAIAELKTQKDIDFTRLQKELQKQYELMMRAVEQAQKEAIRIAVQSIKEEVSITVQKGTGDAKNTVKLIEKKINQRLDEHWSRIERFSAMSVGSTAPSVFLNGSLISNRYSNINLIAGTNVTITESDNETTLHADVTINATGGLTKLTATGTVNGVNTSFVFSAATSQPSYVVSDGVWLTPTDNNSNVQWTWTSGTLTVTMKVPPTNSIFAIQ